MSIAKRKQSGLIDPMNRDKQNKAVAVRYEPKSDDAPRVIARGTGKVAAKIIELAREHNIYTHNDPDLLEVLSQLDLNDEIPPDLYIVVAELLAFVYSLNGGKKVR
jgi:flagellar biosynthesis protein